MLRYKLEVQAWSSPAVYAVREPLSGCVLAKTESLVKGTVIVDALNKVDRYEKTLQKIAEFSSSEDSERHRHLVNMARETLREDIQHG